MSVYRYLSCKKREVGLEDMIGMTQMRKPFGSKIQIRSLYFSVILSKAKNLLICLFGVKQTFLSVFLFMTVQGSKKEETLRRFQIRSSG